MRYYSQNKEKINRHKREKYLQNKEKIKRAKREKYAADKEKKTQYYLQNKEKITRIKREKYATDKKNEKEYYLRNQEIITQKKREKYATVKRKREEYNEQKRKDIEQERNEYKNNYDPRSRLGKNKGDCHVKKIYENTAQKWSKKQICKDFKNGIFIKGSQKCFTCKEKTEGFYDHYNIFFCTKCWLDWYRENYVKYILSNDGKIENITSRTTSLSLTPPRKKRKINLK